MDNFTTLPDRAISPSGVVSEAFLQLGIERFSEACRYVHQLSYGYNSDRDDLMILFKEKMGSCTTKHAVIASLAAELDLPVGKSIGIYAMTEEIVAGTDRIVRKYALPHVPMVHCFLVYAGSRVDLTEGNRNGKNRPLEDFLFTQSVEPNISAKDEYLLYRQALAELLSSCKELAGVVGCICLKKGTVLLEEGHSDDTLYVVSSGSLEVFKPTGGGDAITLQLLHTGDMAGILGFVDGVPHSAGIRALTRCELIALDRKTLEQLVKKHPELVYQVMRSIVRTAHRILGRMNAQFVEMSNYISKQHGRY